MKKIKYQHAAKVEISSEKSNIKLFKHQNDAIKALDKKIKEKDRNPFAGLIVLPTGGGKTLTATYWLLKNYIDKNKKILWIAHRHELLEQAKYSFEQLAYADILKNISSFNYRILSGLHDKPVNIEPTDDIIISSKDSIIRNLDYLYENWILNNKSDIFLVIDEAHHATAKTYRRLIDGVKGQVDNFKMMGLTATPFRTAEKEKGLLFKIFPDDIVYKVDLRTLINRGILSKPIFEEVETHFDMTKKLSEEELDNIQFFDIERIGKDTAKSIAENKKRNHIIVNHYIENKSKFKKTIVFALNIANAIALNKLFNEKGVKSDFVVSSIVDTITGVTLSNKENKEKIDKFRNGDLEVLVNVNILTEGTDLPETQTIFLARPTISTILMTQMIGRGLRGVKAGGTDKTYIVGFIDDWKDKVSWVNPEKLIIEEGIFQDPPKTKGKIDRLISIKMLEEFAKIMDESVDTDELESLEFIERIPMGLYSFSILKPVNNDDLEKDCEVLVYDNIKFAYEGFINALDDLFKFHSLEDKETLSEKELDKFSRIVEDKFFIGCEKYPGYLKEDIKDILFYYAQKGIEPEFISFDDRSKYDIEKIADKIIAHDSISFKDKFLEETWNKDKSRWKVFFGFNKKHFLNEVDLAIRRKKHPDLYKNKVKKPNVIHVDRPIKKLSMSELRDCCPEYWRKLSDSVYEKYKDKEGYYHSAISDYKNKSKFRFQIDHIKPLSKGGLTELENLQLLTREENKRKGDKLEKSGKKINKNIPLEYEKIWKKFKRNSKSLSEEEKDKLAEYIKIYGYLK